MTRVISEVPMYKIFLAALCIACWASIPAHGAGSFSGDAAALFGARPDGFGMRLSPDGKNAAYIAPTHGQGEALLILPLVAGAVPTVALAADGEPDRIQGCDWVANDRLVCQIFWANPLPVSWHRGQGALVAYRRIIGVNIDGSNMRVLGAKNSGTALDLGWNGDTVIDLLPEEDGEVLMTRWSTVGVGLNRGYGMGVDRVDTRTGEHTVVMPPVLYTTGYLTDGDGVVRLMEQREVASLLNHQYGSSLSYFYREAAGEKWQKLGNYDQNDYSGFLPVAVDSKKNITYGLKEQNGRFALFTRGLDGSNVDELVYADDEVDVDGVYRIGRKHRVVGADFITDYKHTQYTDPDIKRLSEALRRAAGASASMRIVDSNIDESKYLLISTADQNAGVYYQYDRSTHHLDSIMFSRAALEGVELSAAKLIKYPAKDGTQIPGYLTLPPGNTSGKGLTAIVMPHGGPSARDVWGFDWLAQYFAHQGYAVLQPNFRGSTGYGEDWGRNKGFKSWQIAIGDVLDAGRWLTDQGIAAPDKLGIFGWSYGGYAALQSLVVDQGVFKAAVAVAPVTDLPDLLNDYRGSSAFALTRDFIGVGQHAQDGSPAEHADKIKVPVLLFHGKMDLNVRYYQSARMDRALTAAGVKHKLVTFEGLDHQLDDSAARAELLRESDAFFKAAFGL